MANCFPLRKLILLVGRDPDRDWRGGAASWRRTATECVQQRLIYFSPAKKDIISSEAVLRDTAFSAGRKKIRRCCTRTSAGGTPRGAELVAVLPATLAALRPGRSRAIDQ